MNRNMLFRKFNRPFVGRHWFQRMEANLLSLLSLEAATHRFVLSSELAKRRSSQRRSFGHPLDCRRTLTARGP